MVPRSRSTLRYFCCPGRGLGLVPALFLPPRPEPAGALCMSCTFSAVTEWASHTNKAQAVGNRQEVRAAQSASRAHPRHGETAASERCPGAGFKPGRSFSNLPREAVAGCSRCFRQRNLRRAQGRPPVRRVAAGPRRGAEAGRARGPAGRGGGALPRRGGRGGRAAPARRGQSGSALGYCHAGLTCQGDVQSRLFLSLRAAASVQR